eukprot:scaffold66982_cov21-Cyclotella_meneghiniana.AAC.2
MQVEEGRKGLQEGRKGPALCAPSLSKTSHPQAYRSFSAYYFLAVWCPLSESLAKLGSKELRSVIVCGSQSTSSSVLARSISSFQQFIAPSILTKKVSQASAVNDPENRGSLLRGGTSKNTSRSSFAL